MLGVVHVGHRNIDIFGRSIVNSILNIDSYDDILYCIVSNTNDTQFRNHSDFIFRLAQKHFPTLRLRYESVYHPGLPGFSTAVYDTFMRLGCSHMIQCAMDMFPITKDAYHKMYKRLATFKEMGYNTGVVGPIININDWCAPEFLSKCFPNSEFAERIGRLDYFYQESNRPFIRPEDQIWIWQNTESLIKQEKQVKSGTLTKDGKCLRYSTGLIVMDRRDMLSLPIRYDHGPDGGEEFLLWDYYGKIPYGFVVDSNIYCAHFCYYPAYDRIIQKGVDRKIYSLIDEVIAERIRESSRPNIALNFTKLVYSLFGFNSFANVERFVNGKSI